MSDYISQSLSASDDQLVDASSVELIATVGLMLDLDKNLQRYHAWRVATVGYHLARRVASFEAPLVFFAGMLADCGAVRFSRHIVDELIDASAVLGQKSNIPLFFHPIVGYEVVRHIPGMRRVAQLVLHHHESINGNGYPKGLRGEQLDLGAQILRLADQLDLTLRADQPESAADIRASLAPMAGEDYSEKLLDVLTELLDGELSFGRLMQDERIVSEVESICASLSGLKMFDTLGEWERALEAIGELIDFRNDLYTSGMSGRVAQLAGNIAAQFGLSEDDQRLSRWAAYLQNMGEVSLRRRLLSKSGRLDDSERKLIRYHPILSYNLLSRVSGLSDVARVVRHHHENVDGSGYPEGLTLDQIPLPARILRVADSFFAMTSNRPYQRKRDHRHALKELRRQRNRQFDPDVVDATLAVLDNR